MRFNGCVLRSLQGATIVAVVLLSVLSACVQPDNPCDPSASTERRSEGTSISGLVRDQSGAPLAGIPVSAIGQALTAVSGPEGAFTLKGLPPASGYEITPLVAPPLLAGRTRSPALQCRAALRDVVVVVVVPPASPDVEIVQASGDARMFVAFGGIAVPGTLAQDMYASGGVDAGFRAPEAVADDCRGSIASAAITFRLQVRAPFGQWSDAVLTQFPWADPPADPDNGGCAYTAQLLEQHSELYQTRTDDTCGAALCSQFALLDPTLTHEQARCAEVVGVMGPDGLVHALERFADYRVRVLAEHNIDSATRTALSLPDRVTGAAAAGDAQVSLVPGTLLPVADASGAAYDGGGDNIVALTVVSGGRFVAVDDNSMLVLGDGSDALQGAALSANVTQDAAGTDGNASDAMTASMFADAPPDARAVTALAAGSWVRLVRRSSADKKSAILKLYVGEQAGATPNADEVVSNAINPTLPFDIDVAGAVQAISYLGRPSGVLSSAGTNPADAYVLLNRSGFLLFEERPSVGAGGLLDALDDVTRLSLFAGGVGGACDAVVGTTFTGPGIAAVPRSGACFDVGAALDGAVDLRDVEALDNADGISSPLLIIADAQNDRVLSATAAQLTGAERAGVETLGALMARTQIAVGREPVALSRSTLLHCDGGTSQPVLLVANRQSGDVSVLGYDGANALVELDVAPVPGAPVGFADDADGPSCDDPFAWIIGEDGRVFPLDMRDTPAVPLCHERPCDVGTRGRAALGAVGRPQAIAGDAAPHARIMLGGPGLLGELGFFVPQSLAGGGFLHAFVDACAAPPSP